MTGPEHYQQAERKLERSLVERDYAKELVAEAQVHATLALAAATALSNGGAPDGIGGGMRLDDMAAWEIAASLFAPEVRP